MVDQREVQTIETGVAKIRQLNFERPVPVVVRTPDEAQTLMLAEIARDHSDEELEIGGQSGAMTGLYPPTIELKQQTLQLLHQEVIGFYSPSTLQMVIVEKPDDRKFWGLNQLGAKRRIMGNMVLAHELTHALQDQHFALSDALKRVKDNDDQSLALKSVAEGDATISGFGYIAGHLDQNNIDLLVSRLAALPANSSRENHDIPVAISVPMMFQYSAGAHFVAEAWRRGGWNRVDQIYRDPPRSTQEIMQPELYFDHRSALPQIELRGYETHLNGWRKVDDDTYGELLLKLILQQHLAPHAPALNALPEMAGDRIITLQRGRELTLLWLIAFRGPASASDFADGYRRVLDNLPGEHNQFGVMARGQVVFVAIGSGARDFPELASAIWAESTVSPPLSRAPVSAKSAAQKTAPPLMRPSTGTVEADSQTTSAH